MTGRECSAGGQARSRAGDVVMPLQNKNKIDYLWIRYFEEESVQLLGMQLVDW